MRAFQHAATLADEADSGPAAPQSRDVHEMPIAEDENEDVPVSGAQRKSSRGAPAAPQQMGISTLADEGGNVVFHRARQSGNGVPSQRPGSYVPQAPPPPGYQSDAGASQQQPGAVSASGARVSSSSAYSRGVPASGVQQQPAYYQRAPPPPGSAAAPTINSPPQPPPPPPQRQQQQFVPPQPPPEFSDSSLGNGRYFMFTRFSYAYESTKSNNNFSTVYL